VSEQTQQLTIESAAQRAFAAQQQILRRPSLRAFALRPWRITHYKRRPFEIGLGVMQNSTERGTTMNIKYIGLDVHKETIRSRVMNGTENW